MDRTPFLGLVGAIFALVCLAHLLRVAMAWPIVIGGWAVPMWLSWAGFVIAGGLSIAAWRLMRKSKGGEA